MTPPALLAVFLFVSPAAAESYPSEKELRAAAAAYVDGYCAEHQDACVVAKSLQKGYEDLLEKARACESSACEAERISDLSKQLRDLDRDAANLNPPKDAKENALLRVSALCTKRLAAANARLKKPGYIWATMDLAGAAKAVEQICLAKHPSCGAVRAALEEAKKASSEISACEASPCGYPTIDPLVERAHAAMLATLPSVTKTESLPVFSFTNQQDAKSVALLAALVDRLLASLASATDDMEKRVSAIENGQSADAKGLQAQGGELTTRYQEASFATDRLLLRLGYEKVGPKRDKVNAATTRVTALRGRALAAATAKGLALDPGDGGAVAAGAGSPPAGAKGKLESAGREAKAGPWHPTLLDRRTVPLQASATTPPPDILPGNPSKATLYYRLLRGGTELEKLDAKRRLGETKTVGNPGAYAPAVYSQATGKSCAVAAQVQVLRVQGLLPKTGDPQEQERALIADAERRGFKGADSGTSPEFTGELLVAHGMTVSKHLRSKWPALASALKSGYIVQASVNAAPLWGYDATKYLGHSILVTGAEVDAKSGDVLGVYINDSGDDPPKGGRFLTVEQFKKAWTGDFTAIS